MFRRLCGKFKKSMIEHNAHTEDFQTSIDRESNYLNDNHNANIVPIDDAVTLVSDDLIDDYVNSGDFDDLDMFMRDNKGNNRSCLHHVDCDCYDMMGPNDSEY